METKKFIGTTIERGIYDEIKELGVKYNHLIKLGLLSYKENPQLIKRINELEQKVSMLQGLVSRHSEKLFMLDDKLEKKE